ncbi:helix-turn-helix transcriptional regulator [Streptomyces sp. NPDC006512]|uniref:helix-turn-helix domain-containing protein n=1 Tax=Streptomyces sp. NPDC006512 TaxID=3154307 RepID=UPI0033A8778D
MPVRHVDGHLLRKVRRAADLTQGEIADRLGVSVPAVVGWESGKSVPDGEKLPALAQALGADLDELFPRHLPPDLADLRCDAGYSQYQTAAITGTRSAGPVANAERGRRRLSEKFLPLLAQAYGVGVAELLAAEERSFSPGGPAAADGPVRAAVPAPAPGPESGAGPADPPAGLPGTLAEKLAHLLAETYTAPHPTDAEIAERGNAKAGAGVLSEDLVRGLRTGEVEAASEEVLDALAAALAVPPLFFRSDDAEVHRIISGMRLVRGGLAGIAARGGDDGLPPELLDFIGGVVDGMRPGPPLPDRAGRDLHGTR